MATLTSEIKQSPTIQATQLCRICQSDLKPFLDLGKMPLANGFLSSHQKDQEYFFGLCAAFCPQCTMVQLVNQPDRSRMFHESYPFFTGSSNQMRDHFESLVEDSLNQYVSQRDPFVVELGSNDGTLLSSLARKKIRHLGIEPAQNVARLAIEKGVNVYNRFFDDQTAEDIFRQKGKVDLFLAANVMCHIPYLHSVAAGVKKLLQPKGVFIFEDPYLGDIYQKTSYDQIYDEHVFFFSLHSVEFLFAQYEMELIDVVPQETHGGSMRYVLAHRGAREVRDSVRCLKEKEIQEGINLFESCLDFRDRCEASKQELVSLLTQLKNDHKRVMGYAATSKSTTILNYCQIGPNLVESICDTTPLKQGKLSPGMHIPIVPHYEFQSNYPDYALLLGWNHQEEIFEKEKEFMRQGGKWIVHVPEVKVIDG